MQRSHRSNQLSCETCANKPEGLFCHLGPKDRAELGSMSFPATIPPGSTLFRESDPASGVYILCLGKVRLTISSPAGKTMVLRVARPGEMLGLSAVLSGGSHETNAETMELSQLAFFKKDAFLKFIEMHPAVNSAVINQMIKQYQATCEQIRTVALSSCPREKIARLILSWASEGRKTDEGTRISVPLTHDQIAEWVGLSRETVTRTLGGFRQQRLVSIKGASMLVPSTAALAAIGGE
ncbi:Crp/Fnr family transcriptional regulator [Silvibacterium acidisoli]|uniref:Crp/Fnr family transcriptional regulator n=1 Tax=Acidobacteriaceae bacterium ZG23-2 TaxID=2883246 RepID=UPI00406D0CE1